MGGFELLLDGFELLVDSTVFSLCEDRPGYTVNVRRINSTLVWLDLLPVCKRAWTSMRFISGAE